jgi:hypothetical protein
MCMTITDRYVKKNWKGRKNVCRVNMRLTSFSYRNRFKKYSTKRSTPDYKTNTHFLPIKNRDENEENLYKQVKSSDSSVKAFGVAFGAAWKTAFQ